MTRLVSIGFGNYIAEEKILTVLSPDSAPIRRLITDTREKGLLVDASFGRSTKCVLLLVSGHLILSALTPEEIAGRVAGEDGN